MVGVYKISALDGRCYIGSSRDIMTRWKRHISLLNSGKHHSIKLQNIWNKYGSTYFIFSIIEECPESELLTKEQFYLDNNRYNSLNICPLAGRTFSRPVTETTRIKIANSLRKHVRTQQHKTNIGIGRSHNNYRIGKKHTDLTKYKIGMSNSKEYKLLSPKGETVIVKNLSKFCRNLGISRSPMSLLVLGKRKTAYGWTMGEV